MADLLLPQQGARPWAPADNVTVGEVLNEYNIPLIGLLEQDGNSYLYACLFGELEPVNIWAYSHVTTQEFDQLTRLEGAALTTAIDQALMNRMTVVALASDYKLVDWVEVDAGMEGSLALARRFLGRMRTRVETTRREVEDLVSQEELACSAM